MRQKHLEELAERVAGLNPDAGEIGAGMLAQLVEQAKRATERHDQNHGGQAAGPRRLVSQDSVAWSDVGGVTRAVWVGGDLNEDDTPAHERVHVCYELNTGTTCLRRLCDLRTLVEKSDWVKFRIATGKRQLKDAERMRDRASAEIEKLKG